MLLFVGQGNPGPSYAGNRHNLGFRALDAIHAEHRFEPWRAKFSAHVCEGELARPGGEAVRVMLMKPQTFYNETGRAAGEAARFFKLSVNELVLFHDEIDLAPGRVRVKTGGGAAGNNGVRSMTSVFGPEFRRVRLGVGHPGDKARVYGYLLSDFAKAESNWIDPMLEAIALAAPLLAAGEDERFQADVLQRAPAPKSDPRKGARPDTTD